MGRRVIHWAPKGLYPLCRSGGFVRLAQCGSHVTCERCMKVLIAAREREAREKMLAHRRDSLSLS